MPEFQNPVIVVPGATATDLLDQYPRESEAVWTMVLHKRYERVALHPDDLRYEAIEPAHIVPGRAFSVYNDLVEALRHELSRRADRPTPVFLFPYDWRVDIRTSAERLGEFVREVIARTKLLKHYSGANGLKADLVGHSMGGLIITHLLAQAGRNAQVGKVATLGTPFRGAIEAVVALTTGMSLLTGSEPKEREREVARVTPAMYQLLPWFDGAAFRGDGGPDVDLFDPANMQSSVVESLMEFVRLYSVDTVAGGRRARAEQILSELLAGGRATRDVVESFKLSRAGLSRSDWLAIVGVGEQTRTSVEVRSVGGKLRFSINEQQAQSHIPSGRTGDHTVPLYGALPPFLPQTNIVCVIRKDLGFWEWEDRALVAVGGFHGLLPKVNLVQRLVTKFLRPRYGGEVWGRRVYRTGTWSPPVSDIEERDYPSELTNA